ncbi:MAG: serine hydrolase [Bacteroidota bacterium]|nr:serine hydrolase [Bacteroidota bacterium]
MKNILLSTLILIITIFSCEEKNKYSSLEIKVRELLESQNGTFAIAFKNLEDGNEILINEDEIFHAASTMKTPVMIEVYRKKMIGEISLDDSIFVKNEFESIVDKSTFQLSEFDDSDKNTYDKIGRYISLRELVFDMITISSNFATNLVIKYIGAENINNTMSDIGAKNINVLRGVEDIKAFEKGLNNTTSARDLLVIYEKLASGKVLNRDLSNEMVEILKNQKYDDIIPKYLPKEIEVAHKDGWINGVRHDSGIVFLENGVSYVLILLSKNLDNELEGADMLAKVSLEIYNHIK